MSSTKTKLPRAERVLRRLRRTVEAWSLREHLLSGRETLSPEEIDAAIERKRTLRLVIDLIEDELVSLPRPKSP